MRSAALAAFKAVDTEICDGLRASGGGTAGSTAVVAVYDERHRRLTVANVGDSRAVLSRRGRAVELSRDHRLSRTDERERLVAAGARILGERVNGTLAISRSFGDSAHKPVGSGVTAQTVMAVPEVMSERISPHDEFVVLATDGVWDRMGSQEAVNFVRLQLHDHGDLVLASSALATHALRLGSVDNITVVVVALNQ